MARSIDPAALAAATLAAALAVMMGEGPYSAWSVAIGVTLLALLAGYHFFPNRRSLQSLAVGTITAVCLALALAYPLELVLGALRQAPPSTDIYVETNDSWMAVTRAESNISPPFMLALWFLLLGPLVLLDLYRVRRLEATAVGRPAGRKEDGVSDTTQNSVTAEPHRLLEPSDATQLLRGWLTHAHKQRDRHDSSARRLQTRAYLLGSVSVALSAVVGTSVFVSIGTSQSRVAQVTVGLFSVAATVLTALHTNLNLASRAQRHQTAAGSYKALIWQLEEALVAPTPADHDVSGIHETLRSLEIESPVVPPTIYDKIEKKYRGVQYVGRAEDLYPPPPQCQG